MNGKVDVVSSYPKAAMNIIYGEFHEGRNRCFEHYLERLSLYCEHSTWSGLTEDTQYREYVMAVSIANEYREQVAKCQDEIAWLRATIERLTCCTAARHNIDRTETVQSETTRVATTPCGTTGRDSSCETTTCWG